jgi:hypothetical protein
MLTKLLGYPAKQKPDVAPVGFINTGSEQKPQASAVAIIYGHQASDNPSFVKRQLAGARLKPFYVGMHGLGKTLNERGHKRPLGIFTIKAEQGTSLK